LLPTVHLKVIETEAGMPSVTALNVLKLMKSETDLLVPVRHFKVEGRKFRAGATEG
jgi:hypothetical protein